MGKKKSIDYHKLFKDNLKPGMEFKNYRQLCEFLKIKPSTGETKQIHLRKLNETFSVKFTGHKIQIIDYQINTLGQVKNNRTSTRNTKYANNIEICLLYTLKNNPHEKLTLSIGRALRLCNMINDNFIVARKDIDLASDALDINKLYVYSFFNTEQRKLKANFERTLNNMRERALIEYNKIMMVYRKNVNIIRNELNDPALDPSGNIMYAKNEKYQVATDEERRLIAQVQKEVLNEMSYGSKRDAFLNGRWKVFKEEVDRRLLAKGNILYFFEAYDIVYTKDFIQDEVNKLECSFSREDLNKKVMESCLKSANTNFKRPLSTKRNVGTHGEHVTKNKDYIEKYQFLANVLIKENPVINLKDKMYQIIESKEKVSLIDRDNDLIRAAQLEYDISF